MVKNKPIVAKRQKILMFRKSNRKILNFPNLQIDVTPIQLVSNFNFLGLAIDENINWNLHNEKTGNKCLRIIGVINTEALSTHLYQTDAILHCDSTAPELLHISMGIK